MAGLTQEQTNRLWQALRENGIEPTQYEGLFGLLQEDIEARMTDASYEEALNETLLQIPHKGKHYHNANYRVYLGRYTKKQLFYNLFQDWPVWKMVLWSLFLLGFIISGFFPGVDLMKVNMGLLGIVVMAAVINNVFAIAMLKKSMSITLKNWLSTKHLLIFIAILGFLVALLWPIPGFKIKMLVLALILALAGHTFYLFLREAGPANYISGKIRELIRYMNSPLGIYFPFLGILSLIFDNFPAFSIYGQIILGIMGLAVLFWNIEGYRSLKTLDGFIPLYTWFSEKNNIRLPAYDSQH